MRLKVGSWLRAMAPLATRPSLWPTAFRQGARLVPRQWWRTSPRVPLPDARYLRFRSLTQYGDAYRTPSPEDLVTWLEWCRQERLSVPHEIGRASGRGRGGGSG